MVVHFLDSLADEKVLTSQCFDLLLIYNTEITRICMMTNCIVVVFIVRNCFNQFSFNGFQLFANCVSHEKEEREDCHYVNSRIPRCKICYRGGQGSVICNCNTCPNNYNQVLRFINNSQVIDFF